MAEILNSTEISRNLIIAQIKACIEPALADIRTDRADAKVHTEKPKKYFISAASKGHELPAVYVVTGRVTTNKERGANHVNETIDATVSVLVSAKTSELLTIKAERYTVAIKKILDNIPLTSSNGKIKVVPIVAALDYSPVFRNEKNRGTFLKEGVLEMRIEYFEQQF